MDYNSSVNQRIKEKFVGIHVHACVTSMVDYILEKSLTDNGEGPFSFDDIENWTAYPEWHGEHASFDGGDKAALDAEVERLRDMVTDLTDEFDESGDADDAEAHHNKIQGIEDDIDALEALDQENQEIFEWWIVDEWLMRQLYGQGECVIDGHPYLWGRGCTGQAILLDASISRICEDMGILDGQENSWATSPDIMR